MQIKLFILGNNFYSYKIGTVMPAKKSQRATKNMQILIEIAKTITAHNYNLLFSIMKYITIYYLIGKGATLLKCRIIQNDLIMHL